jgi:hypothetical protein
MTVPDKCEVCCPLYENMKMIKIQPIGMDHPIYAECPGCGTEYTATTAAKNPKSFSNGHS